MVDKKNLMWIFGIIILIVLIAGCKKEKPSEIMTGTLTVSGCGGCTENTDNITCTGYNECYYIDTNKDIYFINAYVYGNYSNMETGCSDDSLNSNITINTTKNIYIINSSLRGEGSPGSSNHAGCKGRLYINCSNIEIHNSTLNGFGGNGGAPSAGETGQSGDEGFCFIRTGTFTSYNSIINCYGGSGSSGFGSTEGGDGRLGNVSIYYSTLFASNLTINTYGGDGGNSGATGGSGGDGGSSYITLNGTSFTANNLKIWFYSGKAIDGVGSDGAYGSPVAEIKSNIYLNDSTINGSVKSKSSTSAIQQTNFTLIARDIIQLKSVKLVVLNVNQNKSYFNFTAGNHSVWNQRPKLILNQSTSINDRILVYFYQNGSIYNLTQFTPHNLTMIGNYKNITVESNLNYNYPYNVRFDIFNDSSIEWNGTPSTIYGKEWTDTRTISFGMNETYLTNWLASCTPNSANNCTIVIRIDNDNPAIMNWTNLTIRYFNGGVSNRTLIAYNITNATKDKYIYLWANITNASLGLRFNMNMTVEYNASI